jgi:hypothetical protein
MFLVGKKLAAFTPTYNVVGVGHGGEPKEPMPICLNHE